MNFQPNEKSPMFLAESFRTKVEKVVQSAESFPAQVDARNWVFVDDDERFQIESQVIFDGKTYFVGPQKHSD